eukprot:374754-Pleurochrysis_carterae.AAC.2
MQGGTFYCAAHSHARTHARTHARPARHAPADLPARPRECLQVLAQHAPTRVVWRRDRPRIGRAPPRCRCSQRSSPRQTPSCRRSPAGSASRGPAQRERAAEVR